MGINNNYTKKNGGFVEERKSNGEFFLAN